MSVFDSYSSYYDLLYRDKDYKAEADYVLSLIRQSGTQPRTLLELGCGTGLHAAVLAKAGLTVTGVDMSATMLNRAIERLATLPAALQSRLAFSQGDIRTVRLKQRYDAVVSLFHVISYQTSNDDLLNAFKTAREHLAPGGCFVFDFWYGPAVLSQRPEVRVLELEDEAIRVTRVARPEMLVNEDIVNVNYTVMVEYKADGTLQRLQEKHAMRYLFLPEVEHLLAEAGLKMALSKAWMRNAQPDADTWGAVVIAQPAPI